MRTKVIIALALSDGLLVLGCGTNTPSTPDTKSKISNAKEKIQDAAQEAGEIPSATQPARLLLAPFMMMAFWMLLGGAASIRIAQSNWRLLGVDAGESMTAKPSASAWNPAREPPSFGATQRPDTQSASRPFIRASRRRKWR